MIESVPAQLLKDGTFQMPIHPSFKHRNSASSIRRYLSPALALLLCLIGVISLSSARHLISLVCGARFYANLPCVSRRVSLRTIGGWIAICTTTSLYPVLKPACGLAAAVDRTTAPKHQNIGVPLNQPAGSQPAARHTASRCAAYGHECPKTAGNTIRAAGHSRTPLSQDSERRLATRHSQTRGSRYSRRRFPIKCATRGPSHNKTAGATSQAGAPPD